MTAPASAPAAPELNAELLMAGEAAGWPRALVERAISLRVQRQSLFKWARQATLDADALARYLDDKERLAFGDIRAREATVTDADMFSDLWSASPEALGEWEVIGERGPDPFAQFKMQEGVSLPVLERQGELVGCLALARYETVVGGRRVRVQFNQGLRVRSALRRGGLAGLFNAVSPRFQLADPVDAQYWYVRPKNLGVLGFVDATFPELAPSKASAVATTPVEVSYLEPSRGGGSLARRARRSDLRPCVALINATHRGMDLFRPYTAQRLSGALNSGPWSSRGELPYSIEDFYVVEERGRIVACGGLWDRGRHIREVWRHRDTGEERRLACTCLLDFGFASGYEGAALSLLQCFRERTEALERDFFAAALSSYPALLTSIAAAASEVRQLHWRPAAQGPVRHVGRLNRPHIDLRYW